MTATTLERLNNNRKAAIGFAGIAFLASLLAFGGWVIGSPWLRSFGVINRPVWPLTAIGYMGLSLGFAFAARGELQRARVAWAVPLIVAGLSLVQNVLHVDLGTDLVLFADAVLRYDFPHPGRSGATANTIFLLLATAAYVAASGRWQRDEAASLIASGVLCLATAAGILVLFATPDDPIAKLYRISVPTAIVAVSLAISFVFWQSGFGWVRLLTSNRPASRVLQLLLPAALVLPLLPSLSEIAISRFDLLSPLGSRLVVLLSNILLVGLVAYWAVHRVAREQAALLGSMEALQESEARLAIATAVHELGVFEWDVATGKFLWSPGTEQRMGLNPGSMPDFDAWSALIEPDDLAVVMGEVERAIAEKAERFSYRYRFRQPNGDVRVVEGSSRAFYDEAGELTRTIGVIVNVTAQVEREAELRRREAQLRAILETVPDAMVVFDDAGRILEFSAAAEALWGYKASEIVGRDFSTLAAPEDRRRNAETHRRLLARGEFGTVREELSGTAVTATGRRFPVEIRAGIAMIGGRTVFTAFARDLTDRLATEERLGALSAELAHVSRQSAMSELAADLAHELNQPLSASTNFLAAARKLIERGADVARVSELLGMASEQTLRAGEIIRRLRAFMARGEVEIGTESIEQAMRDAVELVLVGTGQFHIRVDYDLDPRASMVLADRIQVQQVLVNLLRNAVDALRGAEVPERRIVLAARAAAGNMVEIEIADTGPGIPPEQLERLFSRFTTTKGEGGGMGIGLSISKRIIEAHGGELQARNRPEGGASFRFTLPAAQRSEAA